MTRQELAEILRKKIMQYRYWEDECLCRYIFDENKLTDNDIFNPGSDRKVENPWYRGDLVTYAIELDNFLEHLYFCLLDENQSMDWEEVCNSDYLWSRSDLPSPRSGSTKIFGMDEGYVRYAEYEAKYDEYFGKDYKERNRKEAKVNGFIKQVKELNELEKLD